MYKFAIVFLFHSTFLRFISAESFLYENRLPSFPRPDFNTSFVLRSRKGTRSFKEIRHGLGTEPFYVRVYATSKSGPNKGFAFEAVGVNHVDSKFTSYGGLIYAYNSEYIRIWAPNDPSGSIIFIKDGWGRETNAQQTGKAVVFVEMWKSGPEPNFQIDTVIGNGTARGSFREIQHLLAQIPDRVLVRISPENPVNSISNPNGGFWFHASGSSQNSYRNTSYGGVIFAYNDRVIRLWTPDKKLPTTGCILIDSGWGGGKYSQRESRCRVHVKAWVNLLPIPSFQTDWFSFYAQTKTESFKEITHNLKIIPEYVVVQTRPLTGMNYHFIFEAQGSVQSDDGSDDYGGIIFAYDENDIRLWAPTKNDGTKKGYSVLVKNGWGDGRFLQSGDTKVEVMIRMYGSKCDGNTEVIFPSNTCLKTKHESYTWMTTPWSKCSSICNEGLNQRSTSGCLVKSKRKIDKGSCDFEKDLCQWKTSPLTKLNMIWKRTNTSTPTPNTGPLWGHPTGSYYIYSDSSNVVPNGVGTLTSPNIQGARNCHLTFFWNMYGEDVGELTVQVNGLDWKATGWSMYGSREPNYWRSAYINLEQFDKIYYIQFQHILPKKPDYCKTFCQRCKECEVCLDDKCTYANVAIDDIQLWCEASYNKTSKQECSSRVGKLAGCDQTSVIKDSLKYLRGPAYGEQIFDYGKELRKFVITNGSRNDLVAKYFIQVEIEAYYSLWMSVFSTNETNNRISFQIDEGDWHTISTTLKRTHHLWLNYRPKSFFLKPGLHSVTFRQYSLSFRFDKVALSPTILKNWVDLGMQNYHIPDSYLTSNPPISRPAPKHGRLNDPKAFCSTDHNKDYIYFQVKLPGLALLSRIAIQGAKNLEQKSNDYWIKTYKLKVSIDDGDLGHFSWYPNRTGVMRFNANSDSSSIVVTELPFAVPVRAIRIYPQESFNWVCLRLELYGVYLSSSVCDSSGPELPTTKPCAGDRDCGSNADCQKANSNGGIRKTIDDLWQKVFPASSNNVSAEYCTCHDGHHGDSCQHYGCHPNPCYNNGTCEQHAPNGTFGCSCPAGYHGNLCQMSCPIGYYGYNCSNPCKCSEHSSCDEVTGHCNCYPGYKGKHCNGTCKIGYYGNNCSQKCQCENSATCDHVSGFCNCTNGWTGRFCDQQCPWNTWGKFCSLNCSCSSFALECNRKTGECICQDGYYGRYCENMCPAGTYGWNCTQTCRCHRDSQCSVKDGTCNCTSPGLTGLLCDQPCPYGRYGDGCQQKCLCKNDADCDRISGKCTCASGWLGKSCDQPCPRDSWGVNCTKTCACLHGAQCNATTGQCSCSVSNNCTCDAGWAGQDCSQQCSVDTWGVGCAKKCSCSNGGVCDKVTGKCNCLPGFHGNNCQSPCNPGYYGYNCSTPCQCNITNVMKCDAVSGTCNCLPGWQGVKCDILCSKGTWGMNCSQSCQCVHGSCHPITGQCVCDKGWKGLSCDQPCNNCGTPCPVCYHGKCDASKGQCVCDTGYSGSSCLEACPSGFFGLGCQDKCLCVHGVCRPDNGTCDCLAGWTGQKCDQACPFGRYGYNCSQNCQCLNGTCNAVNGSCSCQIGYHGYHCDRQCQSGRYGKGCRSKCECSNGGICHHVTGQCQCTAGWTGSKCDVSCKQGYYGINCSEHCRCKSCDPITGSCHCPAGWQGLSCSQPCPEGFYGNNCSQVCACVNSGYCNHINGSCACTPGWSGLQCEDHCSPGVFGMQCFSPCSCHGNVTEISRPCHHITGVCNCRPGYQGLRCLDQCSLGFYGRNCTSRCSCVNGGVCNVTDGSCTCPPGYHGNKCEKTCPPSHFGVNCNTTCRCVAGHTLKCNRFSGACSCADGYIGVYCENRCPEGKFGAGCHGDCLCKNGAHCGHVDGRCSCRAGFKGKLCDEMCDGFTFGPGCKDKCLCENEATCSPFNGDCKCLPGYIGFRCTKTCLEGRFGINCSKICDCNPSNTKTCDHKDGTCHCMPGYTHRRCDQSCEDGLYGQDCKMSCPLCSRHVSGPCNKQHGNCTCTPGYHGYQCYDDCPLNLFGPGCKENCLCRKDMMCFHVDGSCLHCKHGLFNMVVMDNMEFFNDVDRIRDLKIGLQEIMFAYYDMFVNNKTTLVKRETSPSAASAFNLNQMGRNTNNTDHDFVVRMLNMKSVYITQTLQGTQVSCVVLDGRMVLNASDVEGVLSLVPAYKISDAIAAQYYRGELYVAPKTSSLPIHLPLIIGVSVGTLLIISILVTFKIRYRCIKKHKQASKKSAKDPAEFELLPYISPGSSHLLAFDNPYYDVLAAMGLEDDLEEEYENPLYDDVSLCSGESCNSSTDDSMVHKDFGHMVVR